MSTITFNVPGQPYGKGRPRVGNVRGRARMFTPEKTVSYENKVAFVAQQAMAGAALIEGAVDVSLFIVCQIPASWSKKKQAAATAGAIFPTTKPDIDNIEKIIYDAINGVVWKDDVQVVDVKKVKRYGPVPGVNVRIEVLS